MKTVDIVIAAKNEQRYLGQCLDALAAQDYPQELIRVIVVDNASMDDTATIAKSKGALVVRKEGSTMGGLRNFGLSHGTGDLIGFMDAHCIAAPKWVRSMVERFEPPDVGVCQGTLTNICPNALTQELSRGFVLFDDLTLWQYSVSGLRTPYPWATGGNCMYRRSALVALGGHDEALFAAEDSDMSWRTVLAGYSVAYAPEARLTHYDLNSPRTYLRKLFVYGRADALVAHKFGWLGKREQHGGTPSKRRWPHFHFLNLFSRLGYEYEHRRIKKGLIKAPARYEHAPIALEHRPKVKINERQCLDFGPHVVYWFPTSEQAIIVQVLAKERYVLDGSAAAIFRTLLQLGANLDVVIDAVTSEHEIDRNLAAESVYELMQSLIDAGIFVSSDNQQLTGAGRALQPSC